jgi:hypothetical protein
VRELEEEEEEQAGAQRVGRRRKVGRLPVLVAGWGLNWASIHASS